jgi:(p)ppGpp synthase/HD superfamily hydrolase
VQLFGATLACLFLLAVFGNVEHLGATVPGPGYHDWQAFLAARTGSRGLPRAQAAIKFAAARHANQYRRTDDAPFIAHPIEVGWLLRCDGQPDKVIAAGLLHDVLEKTPTTRTELRHRFGARIARLVESISDDPSIDDYKSRKRALRERVARGDADTWAIFAADKISKVRELAQLPPRRRRGAKNRAKLTHYRASLSMLGQVAGALALVDSLDAELDRLVVPEVHGTPAGHHKERQP